MPIVLAILIAFALMLTTAVGAMSFNLHKSDAAGNGLAVVYILFFTAALWAMLALILIIAAARHPHPSLPASIPWPTIDIAVLLLFLASAASQVGVVRTLSDRGTTGPYALLLQLTLFAAPLAFLFHAAWRLYGLPVPAGTATVLCAGVVLIASALPWPGVIRLQRPAQAVTHEPAVETLRYPAVLIWDQTHLEIIDGPADLEAMHTNRVLHRQDDPVLIDSVFRTFTLARLKVGGDSLKLPATGPGPQPVEFKLVPLDKPVRSQTARDLILGCAALNPDPDKDARIRAAIAQRETLENMIAELRSVD